MMTLVTILIGLFIIFTGVMIHKGETPFYVNFVFSSPTGMVNKIAGTLLVILGIIEILMPLIMYIVRK